MGARILVAWAALAVTQGCAVSAGQMARTNGAGNVQVGVEPGAFGVLRDGQTGALGTLDLAVRAGVGDRVDLGGRLGNTSGLELQSKVQLTGEDGVVVSVAPALALNPFVVDAAYNYVSLPLPVLIDLPVGDHAVVLGPRLHPVAYIEDVPEQQVWLGAGTSVGFAARVREWAILLPEVGIEVPLTGYAHRADMPTGLIASPGDVMWQFRFALLAGRTK